MWVSTRAIGGLFLNKIMNLRLSLNAVNILTRWETTSFSRRLASMELVNRICVLKLFVAS